MSMIKCKGNRVKVKGNEAQIAIEFLALIRSLETCAPSVLDAVELILSRAEGTEEENTDNDTNS